MQSIIEKTQVYVKENLPIEPTGHDWYHVFRVCETAKYIAEHEGGDLLIIQLAALLHDIADWKFSKHQDNGAALADDFLSSIGVERKVVNQVCEIIQYSSYKGAQVNDAMTSLEGKIVQDADRLDALGAMGIARAFAYGGYKGQPIHDPQIKPIMHDSFEAYKNHQGTTINHFYEKLLLLKDKMNTATGRQLAEKHHAILESFLKAFLAQWNHQL